MKATAGIVPTLWGSVTGPALAVIWAEALLRYFSRQEALAYLVLVGFLAGVRGNYLDPLSASGRETSNDQRAKIIGYAIRVELEGRELPASLRREVEGFLMISPGGHLWRHAERAERSEFDEEVRSWL